MNHLQQNSVPISSTANVYTHPALPPARVTPKELDALLKVARKHNVATLELEGLKVSLLPSEAQPSPAPSSETSPAADMTEEDLLLWSSGSPL